LFYKICNTAVTLPLVLVRLVLVPRVQALASQEPVPVLAPVLVREPLLWGALRVSSVHHNQPLIKTVLRTSASKE
jgi:hypothetical protein